jgi:SH3-like domain-containing protein
MKLIVSFVFCLVLFLFASGREMASSPQRQTSSSNITPCNLSAYVIDKDPNGLNVRFGPDKTFKIIGNLPNQGVEGVGVHITGSKGAWIRIDQAVEQGGDPDRTFFTGEGWVYGPLLGTSGVGWIAGGTPLYKEPTNKSQVLIRMSVDSEGAVIQSCQGKWMYIEHKGVKGWAQGDELCDNSLTNCN